MSQSRTLPSVLPRATREHRGTRVLLTGFTIVLLIILLLLPLTVIFTEALSHGLGAVGVALTDPDSLASIQLTLLVAAVSVYWRSVNVAVTASAELTVTKQVPVPVQAPVQPPNVESALGVAVKVATVPGA